MLFRRRRPFVSYDVPGPVPGFKRVQLRQYDRKLVFSPQFAFAFYEAWEPSVCWDTDRPGELGPHGLDAPRLDCTCGFSAVEQIPAPDRLVGRRSVARVQLSGRVIRDEYQLRGEYLHVEHVWVPNRCRFCRAAPDGELLLSVRRRHVPETVMRSVARVARMEVPDRSSGPQLWEVDGTCRAHASVRDHPATQIGRVLTLADASEELDVPLGRGCPPSDC